MHDAMRDLADRSAPGGGGPEMRTVTGTPGEPEAEGAQMVYLPLVSGSFDLTDLVMRLRGEEPYAALKRAFLRETDALREEMARLDRPRTIDSALAALPGALEALWRGPGSAAERRRLIFALWDDCAEDGNSVVARGGREARAVILDFIRRSLPAGSADAYGADELAALNRERTSTDEFHPYPEK
jgi:hypothetical protein